MVFAKILGFGLMLVYMLFGIWNLVSPASAWRRYKDRAEARGIVMVDSPSPETLDHYRLGGVVRIAIAAACMIAMAFTL